jgi:hypothetical protein
MKNRREELGQRPAILQPALHLPENGRILLLCKLPDYKVP